MELFLIMLLVGVLLFLGAFKFKSVDIIFLILASITFLIIGSGLFSGHIQIKVDKQLIYTYDDVVTDKLVSEHYEYTYLSGSFLLFLKVLFLVFGLYLFFLTAFNYKESKQNGIPK